MGIIIILLLVVAYLYILDNIKKSSLTLFMELTTAQNEMERNLTRKIEALEKQIAALSTQAEDA